MRILHVTPYYEDAWAYGGIPRVASALCRGLAARGHQVTVVTTDAFEPGRRMPRRVRNSVAIDRGGVRVRAFPNLNNGLAYGRQLYLPLGLRRFLRREAGAFDVAHLHALHNLPVSVAAGALLKVGVPYLLQPNGTAPLIEQRRVAKWVFDRTLGRGVISGAARLLAVSEAERPLLEALAGEGGRVSTLPNPVACAEAAGVRRGRLRQRLGAQPGQRLLLYLGRLSPRKGLGTLLRAVAALGERRVRLVIAGADMGAEKGARGLARELGLEQGVDFVGLLRGPERLEALADADLVLYPGQHEIFGLVVLEALLCGAPVLVADDSGAAELVARTGGGMALAQGDADALALGIRQVLAQPDRWRARARQAAAVVRARYDTPVVCAALEAAYQEVVAHG